MKTRYWIILCIISFIAGSYIIHDIAYERGYIEGMAVTDLLVQDTASAWCNKGVCAPKEVIDAIHDKNRRLLISIYPDADFPSWMRNDSTQYIVRN